MPPFENDPSKPIGSATNPQRDASAASGSNTEAEGSAAHIAELVRRTYQREAGADATSAARPEATIAEPMAHPPARTAQTVTIPSATAPAAQAATTPATTIPATTAAPAVVPRATRLSAPRVRPTLRRPSLRLLAAVGVVAALLIAGGLALSLPGGSDPGQTSPPATAAPAPAGYAVQVTDEITDCANHSRGRTKTSFRDHNCVKATRTLGSGRVDGRPVLFVVARIEMESSEAATSVIRVLDGYDTGNLNDLLREGKTFPGAPDTMPISGYASARAGAVVLVAEAGFSDGGASSNDDPALRSAAAKVAARLKAEG